MFYYQQQIIASNSLILSWDLWSFVLEKDWRIIGKNCLMIDVVWTKLVESEKCLIWRPDFKTGANVAMKWSWIIFYIFPPNIIHNHRNTFCPLLLLLRHKIVAPRTRSDKISPNKISCPKWVRRPRGVVRGEWGDQGGSSGVSEETKGGCPGWVRRPFGPLWPIWGGRKGSQSISHDQQTGDRH